MLTVADADSFLSTPKSAVSAMEWRPGLLKRTDVQWWDWDCAIEINGMVPEGTRVILQWRPAVGAASAKYNCGLLYRNDRVYALDFDPEALHTNKVGVGRAQFRKRFGPGTHEHTWSAEGYGYAEPLQNFADFAGLFDCFCTKTTLQVKGGFKRPPSQQLSLGLI